jgi:serine/threonine-protein kinase
MSETTDAGDGRNHEASAPRLAQVGDYRILREVGRGGMGVVFEAEQVSLGRRVALKVLPRHVAADRTALERFHREARAAARLHHTNIVPVFEVGRDRDVVYYAMQFIEGHGLDVVVRAVARLRVGPSPQAAATTREALGVSRVAASLLTGRLTASDSAVEATGVEATAPLDREGRTAPGAHSSAAGPSAPVLSATVLPLSSLEGSGRRTPFARSVAQLGIQVAQALAYAHARGVVHRDIKPSNLLLDQAGVVWITDFGLAKAEEDGLTQTGDVLGTLRYMAPERFRGEGDGRADLYALGLTLYELLTLRPAFAATDRLELMERIKGHEPERPRTLDARIPRDLETIVLKAIEKDPARRYATAGALAEDLRRFLADEPIAARRASALEHAARWAKRHPAQAALGGVVAGVLVIATIASSWIAGHMANLAKTAQLAARGQMLARQLADREARAAEAARSHEAELRRQADQSRHDAEKALGEAKAQSARAEHNFARARAAVDDYLTTVSESPQLAAPGLQPVRRALLRSALVFYQRFLEERAQDSSIRAGLAAAYLRVGKIQIDLGEIAAADEAFVRAATLFAALLTETPGDAELVHGLAECHFRRGRYDQAIALWKPLVRLDQPRFGKALANTYNNLAVRQQTADLDAALATLQQALVLWEEIVRLDPEDPEAQSGLGGTLNNLGALLGLKDRPREALALYLRAVEHHEAAYGRMPHVILYGQGLVIALHNVGLKKWVLEADKVDALGWLRRSYELLRRLAGENPLVPLLQASLYRDGLNLAAKLRGVGRGDEAARIVRAARAARERLPSHTPEELFALGCARALCAEPLFRTDPDALDEDDPDERKRDAERALEALGRAVDTGFRDVERLRQADELRAFRDREGFRTLIARAEALARAEAVARSDAPAQQKLEANQVLLAQRQKLAGADVKDRNLQADVAASQHAIGVLQLGQGKLVEADRTFAEELIVRAALAKAEPSNAAYREALATAQLARGDSSWKLGRWAEGGDLARAGLDRLTAWARESPEDVALQAQLRGAAVKVGNTIADLGLWAEAAALRQRGAYIGISAEDYGDLLLVILTGTHEDFRRATAALLRKPRSEGSEVELLRTVLLAPESAAEPAFLVSLAERRKAWSQYEPFWVEHNLGLAYYRAGRYEDAVEHLGPITEVPPVALAMAHHRLGHAKEAHRLLRRADAWYENALRQTLATPALRLATPWWVDVAAFEVMRHEAGALIEGRERPVHPLMRLQRARAYVRLEQPVRAAAEFQAAVAAMPEDPGLWLARGRVYEQLGRWREARADFAHASTLPPKDPRPWIEQGRYLAEQGRPAEADAAYLRAASLAKGAMSPFLESDWWVAGPYPETTTLERAAAPYPPEDDADPSRPAAAESGPGDLPWRTVPAGPQGRVDLSSVLGKATCAAYALTYVYSLEERGAALLVGGDDTVRLWLNGRLVFEDLQAWANHGIPGRLARVAVKLRAGRNTILAKVSNVEAPFGVFALYVRTTDGSFERGRDLARLGLWAEAAAVLAPEIGDGGPAMDVQRLHVLLLRMTGDEAGLRAYVRRLVGLHGKLGHPESKLTALYGGLLGDPSALPRSELVERAEALFRASGKARERFLFALAQYRAGRADETVHLLDEGNELASWPRAWAVLAMAQHRLGHDEEARGLLTKAGDWYDSAVHEAESSGRDPVTRGDLSDQAEFEVLFAEARREVEGFVGPDSRRRALQDKVRARLAALDQPVCDEELDVLADPGSPQGYLVRAGRRFALGRTQEAEADLDRAVELARNDPVVWARRGRVHASYGRFEAAAADFLRAIDLAPEGSDRTRLRAELVRHGEVFQHAAGPQPNDVWLWDARLTYLVARGRWREAEPAADHLYSLMARVNSNDPVHAVRLATVRAASGDAEGYRTIRRALAERFALSDDPTVPERAAKAGLLLPGTPEEIAPLVAMAERAVTGTEQHIYFRLFRVARGLAAYRAGEFARAIEWLKAVPADSGNRTEELAWAVLACAHQRLGHRDDARWALERIRTRVRRAMPRIERGQLYGNEWHDWLALLILLREAEDLVLDTGFPSKPFAPGP